MKFKTLLITVLFFAIGFVVVSFVIKPILQTSKYPKHITKEAEKLEVEPEKIPEKKIEEEKPVKQTDEKIPDEIYKGTLFIETVEERVSKLSIKNQKPLENFNSTRFKIDENKVTYANMEIKGADPKTFTPLASDYAKDENTVYFRNAIVSGAESKTFEVLGFNYGKDAKNIFYENYEINMESQDNDKKPDYDTFQVLGEDYAMDKDNLYCWGEIQRREHPPASFFGESKEKRPEESFPWATPCNFTNKHFKSNSLVKYDDVKIKGVDINTFVRLGNLYAADKENIYCDFTLLEGADYNSFHSPIVNGNRFEPQRHAIDKNNAYYFCHQLEDVDIDSFEIIPSRKLREPVYSKDKNNIYHREFKIAGADMETFEILEGSYAKDKNNIYYREYMLVGADVESFTYEHGTAQDKYSKFQQGARKGEENPEVEVLGGGYKKYKGNIYFHNRKIEGVDISSFYYDEDDSWIAFDKENAFCGGQLIEGIDLKTMKHLEYGYLTDKNYVYYVNYYEVRIIEGADPETFKIVNYHKSKDKNHNYYDGIIMDQ